MSNLKRFVLAAFAVALVLIIIGRVRQSPSNTPPSKEEVDERKRAEGPGAIANPYLLEYSGVYHVSPGGAEAFALADNGRASWTYGYKQNGKVETVTKPGSWVANEGFISISIEGNTGLIVENYDLKNGIFRNTESGLRYLTKRQP
jgi:hypothetical protein